MAKIVGISECNAIALILLIGSSLPALAARGPDVAAACTL